MKSGTHRHTTIHRKILLTLFAATLAAAEEIPSPERVIVVSIPDRKVVLLESGVVAREYPAAVGKAKTPTPVGEFTIANRVIDPTWYGPKKVVPPGPANPLGTRWLGLNRPHYGIHGTNDPASIGKAASAGCIRMHKEHVEELYELVEVGDRVVFSDRPYEVVLQAYLPAAAALVDAGD